MENTATPDQLLNWRFQQALFRAYYDAYVRRRLIFETDLQKSAFDILAKAKKLGANDAMDQAKTELARATSEPVAPELAPFLTEHANASNQRTWPADDPLRTQCAGVKGGHFAMVAPVLAGVGGQNSAFCQGVVQQAEETRGLMGSANFDAARFGGSRSV